MKNYFVYGMSNSGKDTISNYLRDKYGYAKLRIARTIKQIICEKHDITYDELEELKRNNPTFRLEHHEVSKMLGNKKSSMRRLIQLIDGRSMDFEYVDAKKPRVICDCRDFEEADMMLDSGWVGIFLTRTTGEFRDSSHYTEQFMFGNNDLKKLSNIYGLGRLIVIDNRIDKSDESLFVDNMIKYDTNGSPEELYNTIDQIIRSDKSFNYLNLIKLIRYKNK